MCFAFLIPLFRTQCTHSPATVHAIHPVQLLHKFDQSISCTPAHPGLLSNHTRPLLLLRTARTRLWRRSLGYIRNRVPLRPRTEVLGHDSTRHMFRCKNALLIDEHGWYSTRLDDMDGTDFSYRQDESLQSAEDRFDYRVWAGRIVRFPSPLGTLPY